MKEIILLGKLIKFSHLFHLFVIPIIVYQVFVSAVVFLHHEPYGYLNVISLRLFRLRKTLFKTQRD